MRIETGLRVYNKVYEGNADKPSKVTNFVVVVVVKINNNKHVHFSFLNKVVAVLRKKEIHGQVTDQSWADDIDLAFFLLLFFSMISFSNILTY